MFLKKACAKRKIPQHRQWRKIPQTCHQSNFKCPSPSLLTFKCRYMPTESTHNATIIVHWHKNHQVIMFLNTQWSLLNITRMRNTAVVVKADHKHCKATLTKNASQGPKPIILQFIARRSANWDTRPPIASPAYSSMHIIICHQWMTQRIWLRSEVTNDHGLVASHYKYWRRPYKQHCLTVVHCTRTISILFSGRSFEPKF